MSAPEPPSPGELLRRIVVGELAEDSPEARELFARDPGARERLAELRAVARLLDDAAAEERATLAAAAPQRAAGPGREPAPGSGPGPRREGDAGGPPRRRRPRWLLLAAAALVAALALELVPRLLDGGDPAGLPDVPLGGEDLRLLAPLGRTERYGTFRWESSLAPDAAYTVEVRDASAGGDPNWTLVSPRLTQTEWTPPPDALFPDRIRWEVVARSSAGAFLSSASGFAWR